MVREVGKQRRVRTPLRADEEVADMMAADTPICMIGSATETEIDAQDHV